MKYSRFFLNLFSAYIFMFTVAFRSLNVSRCYFIVPYLKIILLLATINFEEPQTVVEFQLQL